MLTPGKLTHFQKGDDFKDILTKNKNQVLFIEFLTEWCIPCKALEPKLIKFCQDNNYCLLSIDAEKHPDIAEELDIENVPHVFGYVKGKKVLDFNGANEAFFEKCIKVINQTLKK